MYGTMCIVEFPADPFGLVEGVRAYSIAAINEFYAQQPNLQLLLPAPAEEARADRIETRRMMYLPAKYAPLLLDAKGYTAQEVWARLIPALEMDQKLEECQILVDWLRVAITAVPDEQEAGGQLLIRSPLTNAGELLVPMADRELLEHRQRIINHDLPGRHRMEHGLEGSILQLANAVANNTRDAHEARLAHEEERGRDKLPSQCFPLIDELMRYCNVNDEAQLPDLWQALASSTKKQDLSILQDKVTKYAVGPYRYGSATPIVSPQTLQHILALTFSSASTDDFKTGLQPFIVMDGTEEHRANNMEIAQVYGLLMEGSTSLSYSDLEVLRSKETRTLPVSFYDLEKCLGMFGNLAAVVLGDLHPLMVAYRPFWNRLTTHGSLRDKLYVLIDQRLYLKPVHVMRRVQLKFTAWFEAVKTSTVPSTPNFLEIWDDILEDKLLLPYLPYNLHVMAHGKLPQGGSSVGPTLSTNSTTSSFTMTAAGSATATPSVKESGDTVKPRPAWQRSEAVDAEIQALLPAGRQIKQLIGDSEPPTNDTGTTMCLSYHVRGGCWSTCRRKEDHRPQAAGKKERLKNYMRARAAQL